MTQNKIEFMRYRDFGQILNSTFEFIRQNFLPLLKSLIFIVGPFLLITGILLGFYQKSVLTIFNITSFSQMGIIALLLIILIFLVTQMMLTTVYSFILIYLSKTEFTPISIDEIWDSVKQNFYKVLGLNAVIFFLFLIYLTIFLLIIVAVSGGTSGSGLGIFLFFILFILLVFIMVKMCLAYMIMLYERTGIWASIQRSFYLTKNKWWFSFGLIFVLSLIQSLMGFIFQIPQYIIMVTTMFNSLDGSGVSGVTEILIMLTSIIAAFQYLLFSLIIIALAFLYFSLVEQKEGKGLIERIESIQ
ncbi:MAG: hypothetical protein PHY57_11810 [Ignavibacterium sp.]|jgi:hypothetical protein|nr:hypothetical protein [Ignavibacterium sp.]MDX9712835.1 hypothetical protein [Ignavibacteriaceae bacterium]MEB2353703.1 hypothetical protein [Ignavibacteriales bacterium]GIK23286.1 MAG: hypothetical protein BroJett005_27000 [Ignavibacteriota bacterium]